MGCGNDVVFRVKRCADMAHSLVGYLQMFSDKAVTSLRSKTLVAYSVYVVLLNSSLTYRRWLIENRHPLFVFLPVRWGQGREMKKKKG